MNKESKVNNIKISPSLLAADFTDLKHELSVVEAGGCDMVHLDVMDGRFVPNITIGPFIVEAVNRATDLPLDTHLMIEEPWNYIDSFAAAGSDLITVHQEACEKNLSDVLKLIRKAGCSTGVSIKPHTSEKVLDEFLDDIDMILIMSVNPGFGGQSFMPEVLDKIRSLRKIYDKDIEIDGGINPETAKLSVDAGANVLVAGTAIFRSDDPAQTVRLLKNSRI